MYYTLCFKQEGDNYLTCVVRRPLLPVFFSTDYWRQDAVLKLTYEEMNSILTAMLSDENILGSPELWAAFHRHYFIGVSKDLTSKEFIQHLEPGEFRFVHKPRTGG